MIATGDARFRPLNTRDGEVKLKDSVGGWAANIVLCSSMAGTI